MDALDSTRSKGPLPPAHPFDIEGAKARLAAADGGYEIVHQSEGLEIGVYVLVAPEPDRQQPHADDEVYIVLEGKRRPRGRRQAGGAARRSCGVRSRRRGAPVHRLRALAVLVIFERR